MDFQKIMFSNSSSNKKCSASNYTSSSSFTFLLMLHNKATCYILQLKSAHKTQPYSDTVTGGLTD